MYGSFLDSRGAENVFTFLDVISNHSVRQLNPSGNVYAWG